MLTNNASLSVSANMVFYHKQRGLKVHERNMHEIPNCQAVGHRAVTSASVMKVRKVSEDREAVTATTSGGESCYPTGCRYGRNRRAVSLPAQHVATSSRPFFAEKYTTVLFCQEQNSFENYLLAKCFVLVVLVSSFKWKTFLQTILRHNYKQFYFKVFFYKSNILVRTLELKETIIQTLSINGVTK